MEKSYLIGEKRLILEKKRIASYVDPCYNINCQKLNINRRTAGRSKAYRLFRPIPQAAIDLNQAKVTQNPGY